MSMHETIRARIEERRRRIRAERQAGRGWWAALKAAFSMFDRDVDERAAKQAEEEAERRARANRRFPPHENDYLPGGRLEGKRRPKPRSSSAGRRNEREMRKDPYLGPKRMGL